MISAVVQYLEQDVESCVSFAVGQNEADVLEWLLHLAVSYLYEDMDNAADYQGIFWPAVRSYGTSSWTSLEGCIGFVDLNLASASFI